MIDLPLFVGNPGSYSKDEKTFWESNGIPVQFLISGMRSAEKGN
jgi:hypothetical protein